MQLVLELDIINLGIRLRNSKAEHKKDLVNSPLIDFGPYDGQISVLLYPVVD